MKLNNKGFAITAVLYGILILFVFTTSTYLIALSMKKDRLTSVTDDIANEYQYNETLPEYTITYNVNGGTGGPISQRIKEGKKLKVSALEPTRTGYIFRGWGTTIDDTTVDYSPGGEYDINSSRELFAIWTAS